MITSDGWRYRPGMKEHTFMVNAGLELIVYKGDENVFGDTWCMRLCGWNHPQEQTLGTSDIAKAKTLAFRRAGMLLAQATSQFAAALIERGTGMNT